VLVNGKFLSKHPGPSAAATRAILKAAKWVEANPGAAARLSVEARYIASSAELNSYAISNLDYAPSVIGAQDAVISAAGEMKSGGILDPRTDPIELARKSFVQLEGVSDRWLEAVVVNKEPDGGIPARWDVDRLAKVMLTSPLPACCRGAMR
jgi:NitT/TauT family transport system substrate-binding protein